MESSIGKRIQAGRKALGLTQEQLAEKLSVSGQAVSKWESDISCPDITTLPQLADILGVSVDELLRGKPETVPETMELAADKGKDINEMFLCVFVTADDDGKDVNVKIKIPIPVIRALVASGMDMKQIFAMQGVTGQNVTSNIDFDAVMTMINNGVCGTLVDIEVENEANIRLVVE